MHSRIFQVSSEPIKNDELIDECRYEDWDTADYVVEQTTEEEQKSDMEWIMTACKGIKVDTEKRTITITSKKEYFDERHDRFKELAEELSDITLEDFISTKMYFKFYELQSCYEDKCGFYIDDNDEYTGLTNMDNWVRNTEENKVYYIGSIFDYHF